MRERDHQIGLHGLALLRLGSADAFAPPALDTDAAAAAERAAIAALLDTDAPREHKVPDPFWSRGDRGEEELDRGRRLERVGVRAGYEAWAASYDVGGNRTIRAEEPAVRALLAELRPGDAVDAGCGTGRHTAQLVALGHRVVGVDGSPAMLERARARVPAAEYREGDLRALPVEDGAADLVISGLALSHLRSLEEPVAECARVLRPGGTVIITNAHPLATRLLGVRAWFRAADGERVAIPEYAHPLGAYLAAFRAAGLTGERLLEPEYGPGDGPVAGLPAAVVWQARK